jgi:hypothetical protein
MELKLQANLIESFGTFLIEGKLVGKKSRLRSRLFTKLDERVKQLKSEYQELISEFALRDDDNNIVSHKDDEGQDHIHIENMAEFQKELNELLNEIISFEVDEGLKTLLEEIFLDTEKEFEGLSALEYDKWCEAIEDIK